MTVAEAPVEWIKGENVGESSDSEYDSSFRIYPEEKAEKWDSSWRKKILLRGNFFVCFVKTRDNDILIAEEMFTYRDQD